MDNKKTTRLFMREEIKKTVDNIVHSYFLTSYHKAEFPYAVVDIKEIDDEIFIPYILEVEIWDKGDDTTKIETICDEIKELLDRKREIKNNYAYVIYFSNCLTNIDDDKAIKRRILSFEIHLYKFMGGENL